MLSTRTKPRKKRRREDVGRYGFVNGRLHGPPAFAGILDKAGISIKARISREGGSREVEEPGRDDAAAAPHFGDIRHVQVEPFRLRQRLRPCILEDVETL